MPDDRVTAELGYLRACLEAAAVSPEAFNLAVLLLRIGRVIAAVDGVLALSERWKLRVNDPDWARTRARDECASQLCEAISSALAGEAAPAGEGQQHAD